MKRKLIAGVKKCNAAGIGLSLLSVAGGTECAKAQLPETAPNQQRPAATGGKFYCNIKALDLVERAHHKRLTEKLIAARKEVLETANGYEFQFSPSTVSLAELADWVAAEGKCCPFFDFHIDLEREGNLLCLRLTGEEGIKAFIRSEFQVSAVNMNRPERG
jgi:hypothetical protein